LSITAVVPVLAAAFALPLPNRAPAATQVEPAPMTPEAS
jgi:hypothetical protein